MKNLDMLFAKLYHRKSMRKKLKTTKAPERAIVKEDELINEIIQQINEKIQAIKKWQEKFDMFYGKCHQCKNLQVKHNKAYCVIYGDNLPPINADFETEQCEHFAKEKQCQRQKV